jgi:hypothetical protein
MTGVEAGQRDGNAGMVAENNPIGKDGLPAGNFPGHDQRMRNAYVVNEMVSP